MNILSLFDGCGIGKLALDRAGVAVGRYFASEIDRWAIAVGHKNHPDIEYLGDICGVRGADLPVGTDLVMGGSPCQGFSIAGDRLEFEDVRSRLIFEFFRILEELRPRWFLLENVLMRGECVDFISSHLGVRPVKIDSALVSAQTRKRLYWTNIPYGGPPADRGVLLKDVLLTTELPHLIHTNEAIEYMNRKNRSGRTHWDFGHWPDATTRDKSQCLTANMFKGVPYNVLKEADCIRKFDPIECERLQTWPDDYTAGASDTQRYKMIGNGWTADVIAHLLHPLIQPSELPVELPQAQRYEPRPVQAVLV